MTLNIEGLRPRLLGDEAYDSLDDLRRFPLLGRADLRNRLDDLIARDRRRSMATVATGGSTGEPVTVLVDRRRAAVNTAGRIRAREWWGIRPGDRVVTLADDPQLPVSVTIGTVTEVNANPDNPLLYTLTVESAVPERIGQVYVLDLSGE